MTNIFDSYRARALALASEYRVALQCFSRKYKNPSVSICQSSQQQNPLISFLFQNSLTTTASTTMLVNVEEINQPSSSFSWPPLPECALPAKTPKKITKKLASLLKKTFLVKQETYPVGEIEAKMAAFDEIHAAQIRQRQTPEKRRNRKARCVDNTVFVNAEIDRPVRALTAASVRSVTRAHAPIADDQAICSSIFSEDQLRYATIRRSYSMRYKGFGRRCY
jgi:hypothetical protein